MGNFRGNGVETDVHAPIRSNVLLWANAAYNDSELHPLSYSRVVGGSAEQHHALIDADDRIVGSAKITANMGLDCKLSEDVMLTGTLRHLTGQVAKDFTQDKYITINNRYYVDATLLWKNALGKNADLQV